LRERPEDVPILARHFVDRVCRELGKRSLVLAPAALDALVEYSWPGNVRELQNCMERAVILVDGDTIQRKHLTLSPVPAPAAADDSWEHMDLSGSLQEAIGRAVTAVERKKIQKALRESGGDLARAADLLQVGFRTLQAKIRDYGLT
jgi:DNA-binding NtrC family response regulator